VYTLVLDKWVNVRSPQTGTIRCEGGVKIIATEGAKAAAEAGAAAPKASAKKPAAKASAKKR
jgi:hypothetical protein